MSIKKILLVPVLSLLGMNAFAEYQIQYPDIPVTFKNLGQWVQAEPVITSWVNVGSPHDCASAEPLENTQPMGISYPKVFSGCTQSQERTITTAEKHTVSGQIRNQQTTKESQILTDATYTVNSIGTKIVQECGYLVNNTFWADAAQTNWSAYTTTYGSIIMWNGVTIKSNINTATSYPKTATFVSGGYVYTRGSFKMNYTYSEANRLDYYYNQICREPVTP